MALGVGVGLALSPSGGGLFEESGARLIACWLALPGHVFMALIQMMVVPLVLSSVILGIASGGSAEFLKRVGLRVLPYFVATTCIAVLIGITLATLIGPGHLVDGASFDGASFDGVTDQGGMPVETGASSRLLPERIAEIIPSNPSSALLHPRGTVKTGQ
jgi:Na+/H+-dicarboxylate symporter